MMKILLSFFFSVLLLPSFAQISTAPNIFIITTDGFRWQELFNGADSLIINNPKYAKDTQALKQLFWSDNNEDRRKLLFPFVWNIFAKQGALYGNRNLGSKVSVSNPYKFSYAGYNEIFTGYADPSIIANSKRWNTNDNVLGFLNSTSDYKNKVATFTSWHLFNYIFNKKKNTFVINSGNNTIINDSNSTTQFLINGVQQFVVDTLATTRNDMLTFLTAKEYIQKNHPKVVYIGFGDTDEYAHSGNYAGYLQSANTLDTYIAQLWYIINSDPFYKNNTHIIITTDHGRGKKENTWVRHDMFTAGSESTWLMLLGPKILPKGEIKNNEQIFNSQLAQTIAYLTNTSFTSLQTTEPYLYHVVDATH
jgi:hypothetical protein